MPIHVRARRDGLARIRAELPGRAILDATAHAPSPWCRLSGFYPHGGIPVPMSPGRSATSVEGIWQALTVFEREDVDPSRLQMGASDHLRRGGAPLGRVLGHRAGLEGTEILPQAEARRRILLPAFRFVLEHRLDDVLRELDELREARDVVLIDVEDNADVDDVSRPLSYAALVAAFVQGRWPS
jgi:hypothetical protein